MLLRRLSSPIAILTLVAAGALAGCGAEIGDSCDLSTDCSPDGDRVCDLADPEGYCTVVGCAHDTCPDEAVCVRFFDGTFSNKACVHDTEDLGTDSCTPDEICTLQGYCALRSSEARFCMKSCSDSSDCRTGYECRTRDLMIAHGGEPVLPPGERPAGDLQSFCAMAP